MWGLMQINKFKLGYLIYFCFTGCDNLSLYNNPPSILRDTLTIKVHNYCPANGFSLREIFFQNLSASRESYNFQIDTDRDGLSDLFELNNVNALRFNISPYSADTNGDGYNDLVIIRAGIAETAQAGLASCLNSGQDTDNDSITDCEEKIIGTDYLNSDSDFDGIPDGLEVRYGLNPLDPLDASTDFDGDGATALAEIKRGTPWQTTDEQTIRSQAIAYAVMPAENKNPSCYDLSVTNVPIMETTNGNLMRFYVNEFKQIQGQEEVDKIMTATILMPSNILPNVIIEISGVTNQTVTVDKTGR